MATWAVGDVQGCGRTLRRLLRSIPRGDRLVFVGDLVNRGARSLEALRAIAGIGDRATSVLGNHDVHLLELAAGRDHPRRGDTLQEVLDAPDADELLAWLRARPLLLRRDGFVFVHAGVLPAWTLKTAEAKARALEALLREGSPVPRSGELAFALQAFTRMRTVTGGGALNLKFSGPPEQAPSGSMPWYAAPGRRHGEATIAFGHWASLGLLIAPGLRGLDTGCVWGGTLTALRLEDDRVVQEPQVEADRADR